MCSVVFYISLPSIAELLDLVRDVTFEGVGMNTLFQPAADQKIGLPNPRETET